MAEYFGPIAFPCLGYPGGMSLGLYANGELVYNGKTVAELVGPPRKTPEEIKMALEGKSAAGSGKSEKGDNGGSSDGGGGGSTTTTIATTTIIPGSGVMVVAVVAWHQRGEDGGSVKELGSFKHRCDNAGSCTSC